MRDHLICILRDARRVITEAASVDVQQLAESIEVEVMAALHGGKTIIPSKLFGEITIPKGVISRMSDGDDDIWLNHGCSLDVNIFYAPDGWHWGIYPINHEGTDTNHIIEKGKL